MHTNIRRVTQLERGKAQHHVLQIPVNVDCGMCEKAELPLPVSRMI